MSVTELTPDFPTAPGWYWVLLRHALKPQPMRVADVPGRGLCVCLPDPHDAAQARKYVAGYCGPIREPVMAPSG